MQKLIFPFFLFSILAIMGFTETDRPKFHKKLRNYLKTLPSEFSDISEERQKQLAALAELISEKAQRKEAVKVTVICTHNSRRSHLGQIWLKVAAEFYEIPQVHTFSGGTEATAFNPRAVASLKRAGLEIAKTEASENPKYLVSFAKNGEKMSNFSKKYHHEANPQEGFIALLVCSSADEACPVVRGASARFAIPYEDPKKFDNTDLEAEKYDERCRQIAREMFFVMHLVRQNI